MTVCYDRLFHMTIYRKIPNSKHRDTSGFSANVVTRIKKDEYISLESVEKICQVMGCNVDDILEFKDSVMKKG